MEIGTEKAFYDCQSVFTSSSNFPFRPCPVLSLPFFLSFLPLWLVSLFNFLALLTFSETPFFLFSLVRSACRSFFVVLCLIFPFSIFCAFDWPSHIYFALSYRGLTLSVRLSTSDLVALRFWDPRLSFFFFFSAMAAPDLRRRRRLLSEGHVRLGGAPHCQEWGHDWQAQGRCRASDWTHRQISYASL